MSKSFVTVDGKKYTEKEARELCAPLFTVFFEALTPLRNNFSDMSEIDILKIFKYIIEIRMNDIKINDLKEQGK